MLDNKKGRVEGTWNDNKLNGLANVKTISATY